MQKYWWYIVLVVSKLSDFVINKGKTYETQNYETTKIVPNGELFNLQLILRKTL